MQSFRITHLAFARFCGELDGFYARYYRYKNYGKLKPDADQLLAYGEDLIDKAPVDDMAFRMTTRFAGSFPEGGVFFKVFDTHDLREKMLIGLFRMMTVK